jgi:hypothetical protein
MAIRDTVLYYYKALKGFVLRLMHLPKAMINTISRRISDAGRTVTNFAEALKAFVQAVLKGLAIGVVAIFSITLLYLAAVALVRAYRVYKREREQQAQREIAARYQKEEFERRTKHAEYIREQRLRYEACRKQQEELERQQQIAKSQQRAADDRTLYRQWLAQSEALLSCREEMTRFPDPPIWPCASKCPRDPTLKACPCTIERLYRASGSDLWTKLEKEKTKWHPDRFARCPEASRKEITEKAQEMFKIIQNLLDRHGNS